MRNENKGSRFRRGGMLSGALVRMRILRKSKKRRREKRKKAKQDVVDTLWGIGGCLFFIALGIGSFLFFIKVLPAILGQ